MLGGFVAVDPPQCVIAGQRGKLLRDELQVDLFIGREVYSVSCFPVVVWLSACLPGCLDVHLDGGVMRKHSQDIMASRISGGRASIRHCSISKSV